MSGTSIIAQIFVPLKKGSGVATSECYFLQISKIMEFQEMLLTRIQNSLHKVYNVHIETCNSFETCGSFETFIKI